MVSCAGLTPCINPATPTTSRRRVGPRSTSSTRGLYGDILRVPDARALIGASAASQLGDWLYNAVLLGYVYEATGSAAWVGAATICRLLPFVLLGPVGGVIADRYDRRSVLLAGDLLRCLLMLGLAAVVAGDGPVLLVIGLTALASAAGSAERPAALALLPRLVGESRFGPANALLHTVQDLGVVFGPAIGAVLLVVAPDYVAFIVNAGTFAVSAALISTLRRRPHPVPAQAGERAGAQFRHGLRTARRTPFVVPLLLVVGMVEFTYGAQTVQLVLYAGRELGFGAEGYGYLLAAAGVGGLASALINGRLAASTRVSSIVILTGALFCATQLVYAASGSLAVALVATLLGGVGFVACEVVAETALARVVPGDVLGRVMGVVDAVAVGTMVCGAALAPVVIAWTSLTTSLVVLGVAAILVILLCLPALRGLDALSRERARCVGFARGGPQTAADRRRGAARPARAARLRIAAHSAPTRGRHRRPGRAGARVLRRHRRTCGGPPRRRGGRAPRPG